MEIVETSNCATLTSLTLNSETSNSPILNTGT